MLVFLSKQHENYKVTNVKSYFHSDNHRLSENDIVEYVLQRFQDVKSSTKIKNMIAFHTANKYMIMAHNQSELKILGNIVASYKKISFAKILEDYENHLLLAMSKIPTVKTHTNVIMHIFGYFLKHLNQNEKQLFFDRLEQFKESKISLGKMLLEIDSVAYRFDSTYLASQTYFLLYSDIDPNGIFQSANIRKKE
ncbi:MAG: DUF1722 domain-containing protein [Nitrosarchaeum sp.]